MVLVDNRLDFICIEFKFAKWLQFVYVLPVDPNSFQKLYFGAAAHFHKTLKVGIQTIRMSWCDLSMVAWGVDVSLLLMCL